MLVVSERLSYYKNRCFVLKMTQNGHFYCCKTLLCVLREVKNTSFLLHVCFLPEPCILMLQGNFLLISPWMHTCVGGGQPCTQFSWKWPINVFHTSYYCSYAQQLQTDFTLGKFLNQITLVTAFRLSAIGMVHHAMETDATYKQLRYELHVLTM